MRYLLLLLFSLHVFAEEEFLATKNVSKIAFGSCNKQYLDQSIWQSIGTKKPNLWLWLGDNIYADTLDMQVMSDKYDVLKFNRFYQQFREQVPVLGIWDDHDYGENDGNRTYAKKEQSKALLLSFLDVPKKHPVFNHSGIYQTYNVQSGSRKIKLLLLDTRTFQDPLQKAAFGTGTSNYITNEQGTLLGEAQWKWLESELKGSDADMHIIASSLQVIAEDHRYEMWNNFPFERKRLLDMLVKHQVVNPIFLSGDRHLSEISKLNWGQRIFYDITSSGMTHSFSGSKEINRHRVGQLITEESFATMTIDWQKWLLRVEMFTPTGEQILMHEIPLTPVNS